MEIKRFFGSKYGDKIVLSDREYYHCVKVTRHKAGYSLICCIGDGKDYYCTIDKIEPDAVVCSIERVVTNNAETKAPFVLCQALCKEFDFVVQKAVELGVTEIVPYFSERTNVKKFSLDRLESIVLDAAKQCGRAVLPIVNDLVCYEEALSYASKFENKIFCYENERVNSLKDAIKSTSSTVVFIGSEGGFSEKEVDLAKQNCFEVVSLGRRILKVETASIAALVLALDAMGDIC